MSIIVAAIRSSCDQNDGVGWKREVITAIKETPKTYKVEFEGRKFTLEKLSRGGSEMTNWGRDWDTYHFRLCTTPKELWNQVRGMIDYGHKRAAKHLKWFRDEEKKVEALEDEISLLRKGNRGEWSPIEESKKK